VDEAQRTITRTFTREELLEMSPEDLADLVEAAGKKAKFHGTAVVRKADGSIRYDNKAVPGRFGEAPEDLPQSGI
jgi:hypothetical protein